MEGVKKTIIIDASVVLTLSSAKAIKATLITSDDIVDTILLRNLKFT